MIALARRRVLLPFLDRWRRLGRVTRDAVLAAGLLTVAFTPGMSGLGMDLAEFTDHRQPDALSAALITTVCAALVLRRIVPIACAAVIAGAVAAHQWLGYPRTAASLALVAALYSLGAYQLRHRRAVTVGATAFYAAVAVALHERGSPETTYQYVTFYLVLLVPWVVGEWMRRQRDTAEALRKASVTAALAAERAVIARELHDVVTHHVTAMVVQADAAGFVLGSNPEKAAAGLSTVSGTGRQALTELRHLLQVIDPSDAAAREPAVGRLADLVERIRMLGQPVEWSEQGEPRPTGGGVDLAVYRVVQEALTNAVKYARGHPTRVHLDHRADAVAVAVTTVGAAPMAGGAVSNGRGLTGLRERVTVFGGEFEAGPTPEGGFLVRASIPTGVHA